MELGIFVPVLVISVILFIITILRSGIVMAGITIQRQNDGSGKDPGCSPL